MFYGATNFDSKMCEWNLDEKVTTQMFTGSLCSVAICVTCISQLPTFETSPLPTPQITQSPCPDSVVLNDYNAKKKLSYNSGNKEVIRCFDTSKVTIMKYLFQDTGINADLSSWDVASVTNMDVSCQSLQYQL